MSSQALRHLSMFLAAAIIIWACQTCCRFFLYITVRWNCSLYYYFYLILFIFLFSSVLLRGQKWGMDCWA